MKPFNLEEYLANPSRRVVTSDGRKARIICTDRLCVDYPVCALVNNGEEEHYYSYTVDGKYEINRDSDDDLFFAPRKREGWVIIYKGELNRKTSEYIYESREYAERAGEGNKNYLTVAKIEWEE